MAGRPISLGQLARGTLQVAQFLNGLDHEAAMTPPAPLDPMAGMATGDELARYAMRDGAFFLGSIHPDHGASFPAGIHDDRHVFIVAGSRSGKGLTLGISNALTWQGPLFAIDPKGEIASITALRRSTALAAQGTATSTRYHLGQPVGILDPLGQVRGPARAFRVGYNPLVDIDMNNGGGVRAILAFATSIIRPDEGNGAHFSETAETIMCGLIEAVKLSEPPERQTLPHARNVLLAGFDALRGYLAKVKTPAGLAQEAVTIMDEVGADEWGSHRSTLSRNVRWLAEPAMQNHLQASGFSLRKAVQEGGSIFVALPPAAMAGNASWLRLIVRAVLDAKMEMGTNQKGPQMLCLLDEFPLLGRFKLIEENAGYLAGYGVKLVPMIQNIGQVKDHYAKNWETFLGNAGGIVSFGLNDLETEQYLSDRLGKIMVSESSVSHSASSSFQGSRSSTTARHERPVRFANEIHHQGARETGRAFVIPASGRGFTIARQPYTSFPAGFYDAPDFITEWENAHWKGR